MSNPITNAINAITGNGGQQNQEGQGQQENGKAKAFRYRCTENCTFQGKYRRQGDIVVLSEEKKIPHFVLVEDEKK